MGWEVGKDGNVGGDARTAEQAERRAIGKLLPNNQRQRRTCYALCHILYPVSAERTEAFACLG